METRVSVQELFRQRVASLSRKRLCVARKTIAKEVRREVITQLLVENKSYLRPVVVIIEPDTPAIMRFIGGVWVSLFYQETERRLYRCASYSPESEPLGSGVRLVKPIDELDEETQKALLKCLGWQVVAFPELTEVFVPDGFYLFRFKAKLAIGGYDNPAREKLKIVQAGSFESAAECFKAYLRRVGENCFSDIQVRVGNSWKRVLSQEMVHGILGIESILLTHLFLVD